MGRTDAPAAPGLAAQMSVAAVAAAITVACALLGWWQWDRAHVRGMEVGRGEPVPLAEVLVPAAASEGALGSTVSVDGVFGDGVALVWGREVEGVPAVLLLREFTVDADATGTGEPATLAVLAGHAPADHAPEPTAPRGRVELVGYLRVGEPPPSAPPPPLGTPMLAGAHHTSAVSPAELAQRWPGPLYSAVLVAHDGSEGWAPMPPPEPGTEINLQSAAYAVEWWLFGAFAAFVAGRWIRDSRLRSRPTSGSPA